MTIHIKKIFNNCVIEINKISFYDNSIIVQVSDNGRI